MARPWSPGHLSAYPESVLERQAQIAGVWAPYYTLHKIGRGLLDAHTVAGSQRALVVLRGLAGGSLRTSTRPTLNRRTEAARLYEHSPRS